MIWPAVADRVADESVGRTPKRALARVAKCSSVRENDFSKKTLDLNPKAGAIANHK